MLLWEIFQNKSKQLNRFELKKKKKDDRGEIEPSSSMSDIDRLGPSGSEKNKTSQL